MADMEQAVLGALLDILKNRGLIDESVHNKAVNLVNSDIDFPLFFQYPVCCQEEEETDESS